jgi:hypothetical protein
MNFKQGEEIAPGIIVYDDVFDDCETFIEESLSMKDRWENAEVHNGTGKAVEDMEHRKTRTLPLTVNLENPTSWFSMHKLIWSYSVKYAIENLFSFSTMETPQLLHYEVNEGMFDSHIDDGPETPRIMSSLLYLNDVAVGGETHFNKFDISVKPKRGRLVLFPASYPYQHQAMVPRSNDKFVVVSWFIPQSVIVREQ